VNDPRPVNAPLRVWAEFGPAGAGRGADRGDVVVIVDALRASATIAAALRVGARAVLPVLTVDQAEAFLNDPRYRVAGERGGAKLPAFHYGNSPGEILADAADLAGRTLVLTTSNGTRCVEAGVRGASALLAGSCVNASAVARAALDAARGQVCDVTLVAAGLNDRPAAEDTFAVALIAGRLVELGAQLVSPVLDAQESDSLRVFTSSRSAARLTELGYTQDVRLCARVDLWETVPVYRAEPRTGAEPCDPAGPDGPVGFVEL
jgi:2-phosphosulfolactate phosphatase